MRSLFHSVLSTALLMAISMAAQTSAAPSKTARQDLAVAPVSGESWLMHVNHPFSETSMGKTGHLGPAAISQQEDLRGLEFRLAGNPGSESVTLHGADLYRLNCQGCHGASGDGAPPEIRSVINPVRSTSLLLVLDRMKKTGFEISRANAAEMATQSRAALLQRLHEGGENMPSFPHLREAEVRSLIAYLKQLAGVPGAEREQIGVQESSAQIGEHIAKSTCHTCHSAVGPNPGPQQLLDGAIPPLETLTIRTTQAEFVRKVTHGATILMGTPALLCRGRMPVFDYLSEQEAAAVYRYLTLYPPSHDAETRPAKAVAIAMTSNDSGGPGAGSGGGGTPLPQLASGTLVQPPPSERNDTFSTTLVLSGIAMFVIGAIGAGLIVTVREFKRLGAASQHRRLPLTSRPLFSLSPLRDMEAKGRSAGVTGSVHAGSANAT